MANEISINPVLVIKGSNAATKNGISSDTITAGQVLTLDSSDELERASANSTAIDAAVAGIALHGSTAGQPIEYQTAGNITIGGTVVVGEIYLLSSAVVGGIAPEADVATPDDYVSVVGVGTSATVIARQVFNSGAQIP